jgi:hypothetical protein
MAIRPESYEKRVRENWKKFKRKMKQARRQARRAAAKQPNNGGTNHER